MLCYVMLCYVMLCCYVMFYVMLCYVMLCYVMLFYVMLCYVILCYVMLCYVTVIGFPPGDSDLITEKFFTHDLSRSDSYFIIFKYFMAATMLYICVAKFVKEN